MRDEQRGWGDNSHLSHQHQKVLSTLDKECGQMEGLWTHWESQEKT